MHIERSNRTGNFVIKRLFNAHNYAYICSPYISKYYAQAITRLAKKGIPVKVLTSDKVIEPGFYIGSFFKLTKEQEGLSSLSYRILKHYGESFDHSKLYVADDEFAVSGSANLTRPGMWENNEIIHLSQEKQEIQAVKTIFEKAWQDAEVAESASYESDRPNLHKPYGRSSYYQPRNKRQHHRRKTSLLGRILDELMK